MWELIPLTSEFWIPVVGPVILDRVRPREETHSQRPATVERVRQNL